MERRRTFKIPNRLVCDQRLSPSARKLGAVLYAHRNALGFCCKSLSALSSLSGLCPTTVRKAAIELSDAGYITTARTYRYLARKGQLVYGRMAYQVSLDFQGGFTLVSRDIFSQQGDLTPAAFLVSLCLLVAAGNRRRAFPSISLLVRLAGIARSTVCRALLQIKSSSSLLVRLCRKRNGAYAANSYHFTTVLTAQAAPNGPGQTMQQDTAEPHTRGMRSILRTFIVKLKDALHNLFPERGVVPFLANDS